MISLIIKHEKMISSITKGTILSLKYIHFSQILELTDTAITSISSDEIWLIKEQKF